MLLIQMKNYLREEAKQELDREILSSIDKLQKVGDIMKCYRTLLNLEFANDNSLLYSSIQTKMIDKLVSMHFAGKDFNIIAKNILALPKINQPILTLISRLYQQVTHLK